MGAGMRTVLEGLADFEGGLVLVGEAAVRNRELPRVIPFPEGVQGCYFCGIEEAVKEEDLINRAVKIGFGDIVESKMDGCGRE